jgi:hypothetical protein
MAASVLFRECNIHYHFRLATYHLSRLTPIQLRHPFASHVPLLAHRTGPIIQHKQQHQQQLQLPTPSLLPSNLRRSLPNRTSTPTPHPQETRHHQHCVSGVPHHLRTHHASFTVSQASTLAVSASSQTPSPPSPVAAQILECGTQTDGVCSSCSSVSVQVASRDIDGSSIDAAVMAVPLTRCTSDCSSPRCRVCVFMTPVESLPCS